MSQFTALRQEVNLQTRTSRTQVEQTTQALEGLGQALKALENQQKSGPSALDEQLRPIVKTLLDAHDALSLAQRKVQKIHESLVMRPEPAMPQPPENPLPSALPPAPGVHLELPLWARMAGLEKTVQKSLAPLMEWVRRVTGWTPGEASSDFRSRLLVWANHHQDNVAEHYGEMQRFRQAIDSVLQGYSMSLQRLERALEKIGLVRFACEGEPFDAERMEVVEVVKDPSRSSSVVLEDVRAGYLWREKLFRVAQVRVARP